MNRANVSWQPSTTSSRIAWPSTWAPHPAPASRPSPTTGWSSACGLATCTPRLRRGPAAGPALGRAPGPLPHRRGGHRPDLQHRRRGLASDSRCRPASRSRSRPGSSPVHQPDGAWDAFAADGDWIARMPLGANFFDQTYFPYLDGYPDDLSDLRTSCPGPLVRARAQPLGPRRRARFLGPAARSGRSPCARSTDRALMVVVGCNLFEWGTFLRRIDNFLMDLVDLTRTTSSGCWTR